MSNISNMNIINEVNHNLIEHNNKFINICSKEHVYVIDDINKYIYNNSLQNTEKDNQSSIDLSEMHDSLEISHSLDEAYNSYLQQNKKCENIYEEREIEKKEHDDIKYEIEEKKHEFEEKEHGEKEYEIEEKEHKIEDIEIEEKEYEFEDIEIEEREHEIEDIEIEEREIEERENDENQVITNIRNEIHDISFNFIEDQILSIMAWGYENMEIVDENIINYVNLCYLRNLQYDDSIEDIIRYTIREVLSYTSNYNMQCLVSSIYNYSLIQENRIFNDNFNIVNEILKNELNRYLRTNLNFILLNTTVEQNPFINENRENIAMEDIKLVVKKEELDNIPKQLYKDIAEEIKIKNDKCLICQENYADDDKLLVLPCSHIFHCECVNSWLLEHSHKCPHCRQNTVGYEPKI